MTTLDPKVRVYVCMCGLADNACRFSQINMSSTLSLVCMNVFPLIIINLMVIHKSMELNNYSISLVIRRL